MDKDKLYRLVQDYIRNTPMLLIGTGATIPMGIPGMGCLSDYIRSNLSDIYDGKKEWESFVENLNSGKGLEEALTGITFSHAMLNSIRKCTWELINAADLKMFKNKIIKDRQTPLERVIRLLTETSTHHLDIITTNYDRYIEYSCDLCGKRIDNRCDGTYLKHRSQASVQNKNIINVFKVHGSLDNFRNESTKESVSIPLQERIPDGFYPEIITPGSDKYEALLTTDTFRSLLHDADNVINDAPSFLCIGYGFNDSQIQQNIINKINAGTPIIVVTHGLSDTAIDLIRSNADKYIIILSDPSDSGSRIITAEEDFIIPDAVYWSIDGFANMI